ncbi:ABC transporter substrate-binding protein [Tenacibaculum xiamenense]|uniref:ABC transporter substrate-binding protein n=1 Tax=Tenacibaculum xiamenense TaxID=1261553 RepID=UPI0038B434B9
MRFSSWQSSPTEERIVKASLDSFSKKYPEIAYDYQPIPGNYSEKLQLMLGTGNAPDLFWLKGDTSPAYFSFNVLQPLDSFVNQTPEFDTDDFFPVFKDAFKYNGKYYGFAKDFNAYVLFYNKDMFEEAGIISPPKDWNELKSYAKKLTKDTNGDGTIDQFGFIVEASIDIVLPFIFQNGGEIISKKNQIKIDTPEFIEAVDFFLSFYREGIATIPTDVGAGWNGDVFGRKQVAMVFSGAWIIPYLKESYPDVNYAVAELPVGKNQATVAFTNAYVIPKNAEYLNDSWKLLQYLAGKEGMRIWTNSKIALPTRKSVAIENNFYNDSIFSVFLKSAEYAKLYQVNLKERWFDDTQAAMQALFYKKQEVEPTLKKLAKQLEKYKLN